MFWVRLLPQLKAIPQQDPAAVFAARELQQARKNSGVKSHLVLEPGPVCVAGDTDTSQTQPLRELHVLENELSVGGVVLLHLVHLGCPCELCGLIPILQRGTEAQRGELVCSQSTQPRSHGKRGVGL